MDTIWRIVRGQLQRILETGNGDDYVAARDLLFER
jgi:hypothetical protein